MQLQVLVIELCPSLEDKAVCAYIRLKYAPGISRRMTSAVPMMERCCTFERHAAYGKEIGKWMAKAYGESKNGATIVCLVPARTDTSWWHDHAMQGEIRFVRGRLKFEGATSSAPFPSAVVIFRPSDPVSVPLL